ncbi:hypothetical protein [Glycomyces salinus]|uniref:hypothetical protein n=1 Tax=Glycomyces salinus TaxID=980294 RepID=UPI0018EDB259|nr:hypothetical protein [Glycomyces salinus]
MKWATILLSLVVFATVLWRSPRAVGAMRIARTLAAIAVLIQTWYSGGTGRSALLVAGIGITLFLAYADIVARALHIAYLQTIAIDVERSRSERLSTPPSIGLMVNLLGVLYVLAAVPALPQARVTDAIFLAVTVAVFGWIGAAVLQKQLMRRSESHPVDLRVKAAVDRIGPKFVVHFAGARHSEYQLAMWLQYFDQVGDPYVILVRDRYLLEGIASRTGAPIVLVPAQSVLDRLVPDSVGACFYVNHAAKNAQLIKLDKYVHVQLMHGDSDKAISRSPVSQMYDRVFVAGQAGVDRYLRHGVEIPEYKFRRIGRPQLHQIQVGPRPRSEGDALTVLYTPTWAGLTSEVDYSSLQQGKRIVSALLERGVRLIFRAHPYTAANRAYRELADQIREIIAADAAATGRDHWWGPRAEAEATLTDCINAADAAVSDISGTASDWLYCGRPLAMTDPRGFGSKYFEEFPLARAAYLLEQDAGNVEEVLDQLLSIDSREAIRSEVREYYLGDFAPEELVGVFRRAVKETYEDAGSKVVGPSSAAGG